MEFAIHTIFHEFQQLLLYNKPYIFQHLDRIFGVIPNFMVYCALQYRVKFEYLVLSQCLK